MEYFKETLN